MTIATILDRSYVLSFSADGFNYGCPLTSDAAQRFLDEYPAIRAKADKVILRGYNGTVTTLEPATPGGGPAFIVTR